MELKNLLVNKNCSIKETMKIIDQGVSGTAFIIEENNKLFGVITDGDIRRAILEGVDIENKVSEIANKNPIIIKQENKEEEIAKLNNRNDIKKMITIGSSFRIPVINKFKEVRDVVSFYLNKNNNFELLKDKISKNNGAIKNVLVIGGAGYLGSVLCRKLLDEGYGVKVLDNLEYDDEGIKEFFKKDKFQFLKGDIRNISDIVEAIKGVDAVIQLAGIVGDPACAKDPEETLEINYLAAKSIVDVCKYFQVNRFIFASSCSVYGVNPDSNEQLTEESLLNPVSLYAKTKIQCEESMLSSIDGNFSPTILRMATLYGRSPNMRFDLAVNILTAKALFDKKITIFGGEQWRSWLHIEDAAESYIKCLESPIEKVKGKIFNVLSENYKVIDVGKIINSVFPEAKIEINDKEVDKRDYNVSFEKIAKELNYQPKKKIIDGVREIKNMIEKGLIKDYKDLKYSRSS